MELEKKEEFNILFYYYSSLLTEKQRQYFKLYYLDDFSLGEVAKTFDVSRNAIFDTIKATTTLLTEFEDKLKLSAKSNTRLELLNKINKKNIQEITKLLKELEND
ncbi:MAG: DNA-binding protein [Acholeplasmatales bacterium]|jgi:predicted DNA-binding protein YlxM (UPF0122 family)|nr:DNA-binding protein [Acholeplasmatales bacterium]